MTLPISKIANLTHNIYNRNVKRPIKKCKNKSKIKLKQKKKWNFSFIKGIKRGGGVGEPQILKPNKDI